MAAWLGSLRAGCRLTSQSGTGRMAVARAGCPCLARGGSLEHGWRGADPQTPSREDPPPDTSDRWSSQDLPARADVQIASFYLPPSFVFPTLINLRAGALWPRVGFDRSRLKVTFFHHRSCCCGKCDQSCSPTADGHTDMPPSTTDLQPCVSRGYCRLSPGMSPPFIPGERSIDPQYMNA